MRRQKAAPSGSPLTHKPGTAVSLVGVSKVYGTGKHAVRAVEDVSLDVGMGEFLCLVGASGCGKSTLLNMVAGLDKPTTGTVEVLGGRPTLMFQEGALFPWLTVEKNIELALKLRGLHKSLRKDTLQALLEMVHLQDFRRRLPHDLSGGMRQRVALARALAQQAEILLMDEPFGALDAMTRDLLHEELEALWRNTGLTVVFVTHNVREAVRLGDRVVLLSSRPGRIKAEFDVKIDHPRRTESIAVGELARTIIDRLRMEVRSHG
ncbi:MAG: ABC transporter ATP-binding protein [Actinobacteria bacterium]|nr:ABC transporter ATP-binding protein [Actinomycetota bacterium]